MSRVYLAVGLLAVLCVCAVVCEEEEERFDLCSGAYRCRGVNQFYDFRRKAKGNVTALASDDWSNFYFIPTHSASACTLSGVFSYYDDTTPVCLLGANLHTEWVDGYTYAFLDPDDGDSRVAFYHDGFNFVLRVDVCDVNDYTACHCDDGDCSCGWNGLFECFTVNENFVHDMIDSCQNTFPNYQSGDCD
jgi:hypothetical protein